LPFSSRLIAALLECFDNDPQAIFESSDAELDSIPIFQVISDRAERAWVLVKTRCAAKFHLPGRPVCFTGPQVKETAHDSENTVLRLQHSRDRMGRG
jgi:hypothetical protein